MTPLNWNLKMAREFWKYVWVKWLYVKFAEKVKRVKMGVKEDRWGQNAMKIGKWKPCSLKQNQRCPQCTREFY